MKQTPQFEELEKVADEYVGLLSTAEDVKKATEEVGVRGMATMTLVSIVYAMRNNAGDPAAQTERIAELLAPYLPEGWDSETGEQVPA